MAIVLRGRYNGYRKLTYNMVSCEINIPNSVTERQERMQGVSTHGKINYTPSIETATKGSAKYVQYNTL